MIHPNAARVAVVLLLVPPTAILLVALCFWLLGQLFTEITPDTYRVVAFLCVSATCFAGMTIIFNGGEEVKR